jgi:hypothetical protein
LLRLLLELLVGLLQFALLSLQFDSELLRLREETLGLHCRFNAVQNDTDASSQLIKKRDLQVGESSKRSELNDGLDTALEQYGEHNDIFRHRREQSGSDRRDLFGELSDQQAARIDDALTEEALAPAQSRGMSITFRVVSKGCQELYARIAFGR